jgi:hypothetical protein
VLFLRRDVQFNNFLILQQKNVLLSGGHNTTVMSQAQVPPIISPVSSIDKRFLVTSLPLCRQHQQKSELPKW